jgi:toxin ParE1/3/4
MAKYRLTNKAVDDLSHIWKYTYEEWSESQADRYYQLLLSACSAIAEKPEVGKNYQDILGEIFGYGVGKHIIFYRKITEIEIEVVRILHRRMDLKHRIKEQ